MEHITLELAHARGVQLRREAARASLVRLSTCCRRWSGALRRVGERIRSSRVCCV